MEKKRSGVFFCQLIIVLAVLIAAVVLRMAAKETSEPLRLKLSNLIGDKGGYEDLVLPSFLNEKAV